MYMTRRGKPVFVLIQYITYTHCGPKFRNPTDFVRYFLHSYQGGPFIRGSTVVCVTDRVVNRLQTGGRPYLLLLLCVSGFFFITAPKVH